MEQKEFLYQNKLEQPKKILFIIDLRFFFVFPLLHSNLLDLAKSQPLSSTLLLSIGLKVIEILEKVHKKNILHLDIKPENIMLSQAYEKESDILNPGFIQLIDFELSQQYIENSESLQDVFIGSLNFASKSCHDDAPLGYNDDLESLLYVLFYLKDFYHGLLNNIGDLKMLIWNSSEVSNLVEKHNTKQIKSIKDIKF